MQVRAVLVLVPRSRRHGRNHVPFLHFRAHGQVFRFDHEPIHRLHAVRVRHHDFRTRQQIVLKNAFHYAVFHREHLRPHFGGKIHSQMLVVRVQSLVKIKSVVVDNRRFHNGQSHTVGQTANLLPAAHIIRAIVGHNRIDRRVQRLIISLVVQTIHHRRDHDNRHQRRRATYRREQVKLLFLAHLRLSFLFLVFRFLLLFHPFKSSKQSFCM